MDYSKYVDPLFLERITYIDPDGKRRVRNPYRNRKSYSIIVPSVDESGNFVFVVPEGVIGKSVFVDFPNKTMYRFTVNGTTDEVTVIGIPILTYIEINVVNPKPLPTSDKDLLWDELEYDAQKAIVAAWGDIELICNVLYPATAESELGFDDQNTIKYDLVGWKNNCGNDKNTNWGRPVAPRNGVYFPPQPEPTPEPPPPTDVGHAYDYKFVLRWENNSDTDLDFYCFLDHSVSKQVNFDNKEYTGSGGEQMWLDVDYTTHGSDGYEKQPEIITVLNLGSSVVSVQVNSFDGGLLSDNVIVEVVRADQTIVHTYTIPSHMLSGQLGATVWVFDFDPSTETLTEMMRSTSIGNFN